MYADWKRKTKVEILNNTSKKCNFVLQQFHILRSFLSAPRFRPTWGLSLSIKHIWKDCISITSNNICCWLSAKISQTIKKKQRFCADSFLFLCCSIFHRSMHSLWFHQITCKQSVKSWISCSFWLYRIFCEGRKFEDSCSGSPTQVLLRYLRFNVPKDWTNSKSADGI